MTEFWMPGQRLTCLTLRWGLGGGQKGQAGTSNDVPGDFSTQDRQGGGQLVPRDPPTYLKMTPPWSGWGPFVGEESRCQLTSAQHPNVPTTPLSPNGQSSLKA